MDGCRVYGEVARRNHGLSEGLVELLSHEGEFVLQESVVCFGALKGVMIV